MGTALQGPCEQFWHGQGCPLFDIVHPAFPLLTTASPTLHGALMDGLRKTVTVCDIPEACKFPSLDSCQKRFPQIHKEVDLAPGSAPNRCVVVQVGDAEKFPYASKAWIFFFRVSKQGPCFTALEEDGSDESLVKLELARETDDVAPLDPV